MKKVLHLTLKKIYFDQIAMCNKPIEFREIKPYWTKRLVCKEFDEVHFRNGYSPTSPFMRVEWTGLTAGMFATPPCYEIHLGKILEIRNWKKL